jgi:hypothetical protein
MTEVKSVVLPQVGVPLLSAGAKERSSDTNRPCDMNGCGAGDSWPLRSVD